MFDLYQRNMIEDDIILDTSLKNRYIDEPISVTSNIPLDQKKKPYHALHKNNYDSLSHPANGCQHPFTCKCLNSTASNSHIQQWIYEKMTDLLSICLIMPILTVFTLVALVNTTKRRWRTSLKQNDSNQNSQNILVQNSDIDEEITQDELYYANRWGYNCQRHKVITSDGYILTMYRFSQKRKSLFGNSESRHPILIGHGLFQCSGNLVLNEKDSLVFALVDEGYDVFTGNNRAVDTLEHICLSSNETSFWDWGLKELALYDFPAMIDYILDVTGKETVGYIGHSQGNAQAFIALSLNPELANKMSCFIALAPAIIAGTLVNTFPLRALIDMDKKLFRILFGKKAFLNMMTTAQRYLPPSLMCTLAFSVFCYLFEWCDQQWVHRRKVKYFQFSPRPVSTRLILDWLDGWGRQGVCLHVTTTNNRCTLTDNNVEKIPLAIIYGKNDYLVDGAAFVRSFKGYEHHGLMEEKQHEHLSTKNHHSFSFPSLNLVHVQCIPDYEHMDMIWAHDSQLTTKPAICQLLKKAKWKIKQNTVV